MSRVGVVLGAGGVVGQAFHAGVLSVLAEECGFDARAADIVVGTSAGAVTGALLRLGVGAEDLAAWVARAPLTGDGPVHRDLARVPPPTLAPFLPADVLRRVPDLPRPSMIGRAVVRPWQFRPLAAGLALLAPGRFDVEEQLGALTEFGRAAWPERDLWLCAVRRRDGRRIVFGRPGSPHATLCKAVAASCAVPGYFAPVDIDGTTYVDGGAHSPTNAAVVARRPLDLALIVSPMSGPSGDGWSLYAASRRHAARLLAREVRALAAAGVPSLVVAPDAATQWAMGDDMLSARHLDAVLDRTRRWTGRLIRAQTRGTRRILSAAVNDESNSS